MSAQLTREHSCSPRAQKLPPVEDFADENNMDNAAEMALMKSNQTVKKNGASPNAGGQLRGPGAANKPASSGPCQSRNCEFKKKYMRSEKELAAVKKKLAETETQLKEINVELLLKMSDQPKGVKAVRNIVEQNSKLSAEERKRRDKMQAEERKAEERITRKRDKIEADNQRRDYKLRSEEMMTPAERMAREERMGMATNIMANGARVFFDSAASANSQPSSQGSSRSTTARPSQTRAPRSRT